MLFSNIQSTNETDQSQINNSAKFSEFYQHANEQETKYLKSFLKKISPLAGSWAHHEHKETCEATTILSPATDKRRAQEEFDRISKISPNLVDSKLYQSTSQEGQYRIVFKPEDARLLMEEENRKKNTLK